MKLKNFLTIFMILAIFLSSNSYLFAKENKRKTTVGEPGIIEENILTQNEAEVETEQEKIEITPIPLPNLNEFTTSLNSANTVADSLADFISKRTNQIESYDFISSIDKRTLLEELSDINTRLTRVNNGLDGMQLDTYTYDMPEINEELESINAQLLELNETQKLSVLKYLTDSFLEDHKDFYSNSVNLFEEYKDYFSQESDIKEFLDDIEDTIFKLNEEYNDKRWDDLLDDENDLMDILNQEAKTQSLNK